jgi:dipeptidase
MCDTIVTTAEASAHGVTLFGKNSDREPNEAHHLLAVPAMDHSPGSMVRMTYIEIPQANHTYAVLLAKPFWIWGAEMGANEHGVAIGNEAVFTKIPYVKEGALIGMDLLRLGLERARTAHEALLVMTGLLDAYGQGGNCGFQHELFYHNSYIIADPREAWVFETAGSQWAAKRVTGVYTISNGLTIGSEWDLASPDLVSYAVDRKWCRGRADFHFARCYSDFLYTRFSNCRERCARSTMLLSEKEGQITVQDMMAVLRDHGTMDGQFRRPDRGLTGSSVCMHAGFGPVRASQSVGSMVSSLHPDFLTHFVTGTSAPCTSVFKPVWLDAGLPDTGPEPNGSFDPTTLFWRHELLHRQTLVDYASRIQLFQDERDELEGRLVERALRAADCPAHERMQMTIESFAEAEKAEEIWLERVGKSTPQKKNGFLYETAWSGFNRAGSLLIADA